MLGFAHRISDKKLFEFLNELKNILGPFILVIDSVYDKSSQYKYSHKSFLEKQENIIEYVKKIDKIRSLYCISFQNNIIE